MANPHITQTRPKYQYRFLALSRADISAKPCRLSVEATSEQEARRILAPHFILAFAARLPVKGMVDMTTPSNQCGITPVQEVRHA